MSANLKAKLSEDRFEALALRVQWRHKTAAHHSTDQHLCGLRAALPLSLLHLVLGHQLPQGLRILSLNLTAVFQVPARQTHHQLSAFDQCTRKSSAMWFRLSHGPSLKPKNLGKKMWNRYSYKNHRQIPWQCCSKLISLCKCPRYHHLQNLVKYFFLLPIAMKEKPTSPRSQRSLPQPDITLCSQFTIISENRIHVNNQRLHEDCLILLNCIRTGR